MTYIYAKGIVLPHVEKLHTTYLRPNQRNQDVPQYDICDIRRGEPRRALRRKISFARYGRHISTRKRANNYSPLPLLIFICCLFNNAALAQSHENGGAVDGVGDDTGKNWQVNLRMEYKFGEEHYNHTRQVHPWADLERFPFVTYDLDYSSTPNIVIGDSLPEFIYRLPLKIVTKEGNQDIVTLDSYSNSELIILDFWAPWCSPCVESMDTWNNYLHEISDDVQVLGVMLDYEYKAQRFGLDRGWQIPTVYGIEAYMLNSFFFDRQVVSRSIWIRDGKLIAITGTKGYDLQLIKNLLADRPVLLPLRHEWTYSQSKP